MRLLLALLLLVSVSVPARAEHLPWYRGFYTRVGIRDSYGVQEPFHAWAAFAFGLGYRFDRDCWGIDASVLDVQYDPEEGLHTAARVVPYIGLRRFTRLDTWLGAGLSYGWLKGTVDEAIAKRRGQGMQAELIAGVELPRQLQVRTFLQFTATAPIYNLYDPTYHARDTQLYVYALEVAFGVRF